MRLLWPHACAPLLRPSALHQRLHAATPPLLFGKGEDGEVGDPRKCPMIGAQSSLGGDFNVITAGAVVLAIVAVRFALRVCLRRASTALPHLAAWLGLRPRGTRALLAALLALPVAALTVLKRPWAEGEAVEFGEVVESGEAGESTTGGGGAAARRGATSREAWSSANSTAGATSAVFATCDTKAAAPSSEAPDRPSLIADTERICSDCGKAFNVCHPA